MKRTVPFWLILKREGEVECVNDRVVMPLEEVKGCRVLISIGSSCDNSVRGEWAGVWFRSMMGGGYQREWLPET